MTSLVQGTLRRHCVGAGSAATFTPTLSHKQRELRRGIPLHRVWCGHCGTARGGEIGRKLLGERPGGLVLRTKTVSGSLGLGAQVRFIDREYVPVFEHDAAIHQDRVYISASFGVDEGVERMIERPQKY